MRISIKFGVLSLVFLVATIILLSLLQLDRRQPSSRTNDDEVHHNRHINVLAKDLNFKWGITNHTASSVDNGNGNDNDTLEEQQIKMKRCRNTVQGTNKRMLDNSSESNNNNSSSSVVDDEIFIDDHEHRIHDDDHDDVEDEEESPVATRLTVSSVFKQFSCYSCSDKYHCCSEYEFCVSCCMRTDKIPVLEVILAKMVDRGISPSYLRNQFDLCTMACRTSSRSLIHQREYKRPHLKYCYGTKLPP
ncbi:hypothetical protein SAMD00019534_108800 [Acytostelium subglobosum LB1]|uniref:hypothetical protein n=1 Tax=Acytostelium subglobosum LB1 TaxID=1410327 RepID=UPI000644D216|nr:hypothetical protein SAMD00019534_108800 [Acytostelium subglobosum LB1]GAM27704.1 hypothetical protein SAMD00019534_108800 [Acytostelium subglobosum LB1]|eukprot:XP_012749363.1 hypothetical protein SAMD00019534_108800 [Acytostelium subglobosum LB1]